VVVDFELASTEAMALVGEQIAGDVVPPVSKPMSTRRKHSSLKESDISGTSRGKYSIVKPSKNLSERERRREKAKRTERAKKVKESQRISSGIALDGQKKSEEA